MRVYILVLFSLLIFGCAGTGGSKSGSENVQMNDSQSGVDHSKMDHSNMGHGSMDHSKMASSLGAAEAPIDLQFIDSMIAHHQGAVDMAKLGIGRAGRAEMKTFCAAVIADQEREITQMKRWRDEWFKNDGPAINMDFPGMREGMNGMDMSKLEALAGNDFDVEFVRQMIPHHEGALLMSRALIQRNDDKAPRPELKRLAESIIKAQDLEIAQMKKWLAEWTK